MKISDLTNQHQVVIAEYILAKETGTVRTSKLKEFLNVLKEKNVINQAEWLLTTNIAHGQVKATNRYLERIPEDVIEEINKRYYSGKL